MTKIENLYSEAIEGIRRNSSLSEIFPNVIMLATRLEDVEFVKWLKLEYNGYFIHNKLMSEDTVVPEYRTANVLYYDYYDRLLIIDQIEVADLVNKVRLRDGIRRLENYIQKDSFVQIIGQDYNQLIKKYLGVDVKYFCFHSNQVIEIIDHIRSQLIDKLVEREKEIIQPERKDRSESKKQIQELIIKGELMNALSLLERVLPLEFDSELTIHKSRVNQLNKNSRLSITSASENEIHRIKIQSAILELANKIP